MKFTCAKTILSEAISVCSHAVSSKSGDSVIEGILIRCGEDVRLTGYNYKIGITKSIDANIARRGQAVINARVLGDIVRKLAGETVTIDVDERPAVTITCGAAKFNIMAMNAADYPSLPEVEKYCGINFTNTSLKSIINQTIFAVSDNENKPTHTGALFELQENQLTVVGVDGYRMAVRNESVITTLPEARFIVPGDALKELSRILPDNEEPCCVFTTKKFALFEFDTVTVVSRLLEGEFINYKAAIPANQPIALRLDKSELIHAVERVSIIISERLKTPVRCLFEGTSLKLTCITSMGRSYDELTIPQCSETVEIGFNNAYLLDALKACPEEEIIFEMKSGLSPCTIRPVEGNSFVYLILPVRLKAGE